MTTKSQRRGHVRQRGETYTAYWRVRNLDGQSAQRSKGGFSSAKAAEQHLTQVLSAIDTGRYAEPDRKARRQTLAMFVRDTWLPAIQGTVRASTLASYKSNLDLHVIPTLGSLRLLEVTPDRLNALYGQLLVNGRRNGTDGPLSSRTVKYCHVIVRRVLADAVAWDRIARNPADRAAPPRAGRSEMKVWTPLQLRAFLDAVAGGRLGPCFALAATTGMRRGELLGLRWNDIDLDAAKLSVVQTLIAIGYRVEFSTPKTEKSRRRIGLDPATVATLRSHRARQAAERLAAGEAWTDNGLVFTREDGEPVHPQSLSRAFQRLAKAAGLPAIRFHDYADLRVMPTSA